MDSLTVSEEEVSLSREQQLEAFKNRYTVADFDRDIRMGLLLGRPTAYYNAKLLELISEEVL